MQVKPVNYTLMCILSLKTLKSPALEDSYQDFYDGKYCRHHPLYSLCIHYALQTQVYYDDFETSNPRRSKQGIHELGSFYFTLGELPPCLNASLMNSHLISFFSFPRCNKYGIDKILTPFVEDWLNVSETLCLIQNPSLIFSDVVPESDRRWHLLFTFVAYH